MSFQTWSHNIQMLEIATKQGVDTVVHHCRKTRQDSCLVGNLLQLLVPTLVTLCYYVVMILMQYKMYIIQMILLCVMIFRFLMLVPTVVTLCYQVVLILMFMFLMSVATIVALCCQVVMVLMQ